MSEKKNEYIIKKSLKFDLFSCQNNYVNLCESLCKIDLNYFSSEKHNIIFKKNNTSKDKGIKEFQEYLYGDLKIFQNLYGIEFTYAQKENISMSVNDYFIYKIISKFHKLSIPEHKKNELVKLLSSDINEIFYTKSHSGNFGLFTFQESEGVLRELLYQYLKYKNKEYLIKNDGFYKDGYNFVKKELKLNARHNA